MSKTGTNTAKKPKFDVRSIPKIVKGYWKTPPKGYDVNGKEMLAVTLATMGQDGLTALQSYITFAVTGAVIGMVFNLRLENIFWITTIGSILKWIFISVDAEIKDTLGRIKKKRVLGYAGVAIATLAVLWGLTFVNSDWFNDQLPDLFLHLAVMFTIKVIGSIYNAGVLLLFGKKWGKFKPYLLFNGIPIIIFATLLVFIPETIRYNELLLWANIVTFIIAIFTENYSDTSMERFQNMLTNNPKERVWLFTVFPIVGGILSSLISLLIAPLATILGYEINSIEIYRVIIPLFGVVCVAFNAFILLAKEKVIVTVAKPKEYKTKQVFKNVVRNRPLMVSQLASIFASVSQYNLLILNWTLLYGTKMQWLMGIMSTLVLLPATPGTLMTPFITRKASKKNVYLVSKLIQVVLILMTFLYTFISSETGVIVYLVIITALINLSVQPSKLVRKTFTGDVWAYHQWRFNERIEGSTNFIEYIKIPAIIGVGYLTPFVFSQVGFFGDLDMLYDSSIRTSVFTVSIILFAIEVLLETIPYFFYNLTDEKMKAIEDDLKEREKQLKIENGELDENGEPYSETENAEMGKSVETIGENPENGETQDESENSGLDQDIDANNANNDQLLSETDNQELQSDANSDQLQSDSECDLQTDADKIDVSETTAEIAPLSQNRDDTGVK